MAAKSLGVSLGKPGMRPLPLWIVSAISVCFIRLSMSTSEGNAGGLPARSPPWQIAHCV
jgi:hypothetical protein